MGENSDKAHLTPALPGMLDLRALVLVTKAGSIK
jgi:hypothetical protein